MPIPRSSLTIVLGLLLAARSPVAQVPSAPDTLTLDALYEQVRRTNPSLPAADASARAVRARAASAGVLADPQLQVGWMNYMLPSLAPMPTLGMTQLQVMQMIPVAGQLGIARDVADAKASAMGSRADAAWWEVRMRAAELFHMLYQTEGRLGVMRETLQLLADIRRSAEAMYRVGDGRQTDVLRAQVEIARMAEDTLTMHAEAEGIRARLNALLDRHPDSPVGAPRLVAVPHGPPTVERLVARAAESRPMIAAAAAETEAAERMSVLARRELYPDLQLGVQFGQREGERMGSLMIGASLPLFARRRQYREREAADAMRAMAAAEETMVRAETFGAIGVARAELERARRLQLLYRTTILPQAEATVASARAAYRGGQVDFMTLLESQMAVNAFRQELLTLQADEGRAWAELEMLVGTELTREGSTP
ncbi:MAG: TolC family protein [Gemmatimonadales bacterium]|nr:TolC family protein [Gemmatimonadota bacterium]MCL4214078.1 TolC family protein [Gemmatimonadales bacterium]